MIPIDKDVGVVESDRIALLNYHQLAVGRNLRRDCSSQLHRLGFRSWWSVFSIYLLRRAAVQPRIQTAALKM